MDNLSDTGKNKIVSLNRTYTNAGSFVANGNASIAGTYDLGFTDENVKIGIFLAHMSLSGQGASYMAIATDVMGGTTVALTNNGFGTEDLITVPFKKNITVSFPDTTGGISNAFVYFVGYM